MACNVVVKSKECRGNHERMIRRFIKKCKKERVVEQFKERQRYKKPSEKKRDKRARADRERKRQELKQKRLLEKRSRRKN
jgi:small subunit ribosomal protein S21